MAQTQAGEEALWLQRLLTTLTPALQLVSKATNIYTDKQKVISFF